MSSNAPKILYLDSSDYSLLSDIENRNHPADILATLRELVSTGALVCPLSAIHFTECAPANRSYMKSALARAELMQELACGQHFIFPTDVPRLEIDHYLQGSRFPSAGIISEKALVFGVSPDVDFRGMRKEIQNAFQTEVESTDLSRREKRQHIAKFRHLHQDTRNMLYDHIVLNDNYQKNNIVMRLIPKKLLYQWIVKDTNEDAIRRILIENMRDPRLVYAVGNEIDGQLEQIFNIMRVPSKDVIEQFRDTLINLTPVYELEKQANDREGKSTPEPKSFFSTEHENQLLSVIDNRLQNMTKSDIKCLMNECPSTNLSFNLIKNYILRAAQSVKTGDSRKVSGTIGKSSFLGDWLHLTFAPYVRIFRADRDTSSLLRMGSPHSYPHVINTIDGLRNELARIKLEG